LIAIKKNAGDYMITREKEELLRYYNEGLTLYKLRKWSDAEKMFEKALSIIPSDGPSKLYLDRSRNFMQNPPSEDWDGVFVMTTK